MVDYEKRDRIAYITLNRPEAKNAINPETHKQFYDKTDRGRYGTHQTSLSED